MAALTGSIRLASTLWPLILVVDLGGKTADVGIIAGLIALLEIPFMLMWASLLKRRDILPILVIAGVIYAGFMAALTFATAPWQIYALTVPAAAGAAALLSMPLTYFQDLFPGRPGLGTSFNPINSFSGQRIDGDSLRHRRARLRLFGHGMARRRHGAGRYFRPRPA
ncbi:hypothetical protein [Rhizobium leguminosarum]|uniref:MFS family permease n=1 Tax=Rhizobium leguminosarum TaxID=384 RepID=A0A7W9ZNN7_RHILE|nr:hypothetical protein [Rhizobium leguminosarum]MBB6219383.1 MFS family permease [Rhizobium leguminosarum]